MAQLTLTLLGVPTVTLDGRSVHIRRRKALALLTYLAVEKQQHSREYLATLFWPECDHLSARNNLRRVLYSLHRMLEGIWIEASDATLALVKANVEIDVAQFRDIVSRHLTHGNHRSVPAPTPDGELEAALALYRGEFLCGLSLADCPEFDLWQQQQTENLRADLIGVLALLADRAAKRRDYAAAIEYVRKWLSLDPENEVPSNRLKWLYSSLGRPPIALRARDALSQYQHGDVAVAQDVPLTTAARTTAAPTNSDAPQTVEQIAGRFRTSDGAPEAESEPAIPPASPKDDVIPFVARKRFLAQLQHWWGNVLTGAGRIVFVGGEAGVGKTSLATEFARHCSRGDTIPIIAVAACSPYADANSPYLPISEILQNLIGLPPASSCVADSPIDHWESTVPLTLRILADFGPTLMKKLIPSAVLWPQLARFGISDRASSRSNHPTAVDNLLPGNNGEYVHEEFLAVLEQIAFHHPILLILEDLHWSDASTVALLYHLGRHIARLRALVVGTFCPEELSWSADQPHRLRGLLEGLRLHSEDSILNLDDGPLSEHRQFCDMILDSKPNSFDDTFRSAFFEHSRGHALIAVELLRHLRVRKRVAKCANGAWVQARPIDWQEIPPKVGALIWRRLSGLPDHLQRILTVASVEGEYFSLEVLVSILSRERQEVAHDLGLLGQHGYRLVDGLGRQANWPPYLLRYQFSHIYFRHHLYQKLDVSERQLLHEQIGHALESLHQAEPEQLLSAASTLAFHFEQAKIEKKAAEYRLLAEQRRR